MLLSREGDAVSAAAATTAVLSIVVVGVTLLAIYSLIILVTSPINS